MMVYSIWKIFQLVSSLILKQKKMPTGTRGGPKFPLRGSKLWTKTVKANNVEEVSEPLAAGNQKNVSGEGLACVCLLHILSVCN